MHVKNAVVIFETACGCSRATTVTGELQPIVKIPIKTEPRYKSTRPEDMTITHRIFEFFRFDSGNNIVRYKEKVWNE